MPKIELLSEYYKYHEDVPRIFMMPLAEVVHNFYDKKRRINYIKITKMLKGEVDKDFKIHDSETSADKITIKGSLLHVLPQ